MQTIIKNKLIKFKKEKTYKNWCVYFLINKTKIVYVGATNNIIRRVQEHGSLKKGTLRNYAYRTKYSYEIKSKKFTHYRFMMCKDRKSALKYEGRFIAKFKPMYNITRKNSSFMFITKIKYGKNFINNKCFVTKVVQRQNLN